MSGLLVIAVGNACRRDDGAGPAVARSLAGRLPGSVELGRETGEGTALMARWEGAAAAVVIDAARSGAPPGTVHRLEAHAAPLSRALFPSSSHSFGLAEAVELSRSLGLLPGRLVVYGIEGGDFGEGEGLSAAVARAVEEVAGRVVADIQTWAKEEPCTSSR